MRAAAEVDPADDVDRQWHHVLDVAMHESRKPSRTPMTSTPSSAARMVAAPITLLIPGAGPPPTRMASFFVMFHARPPRRVENADFQVGPMRAERRSRYIKFHDKRVVWRNG